jgi:hypothetical protein
VTRFVSKAGRETAEDATQVFGGRALTVGGMGKLIENVRPRVKFILPTVNRRSRDTKYHRTSGFDAILAGAEDVLGDLGVRQAIKKMPHDVRL